MKRAHPTLDPRDDTELVDERSSVRSRATREQDGSAPRESVPDTIRSGSAPRASAGDSGDLVRLASVLLASLPPGHPRARLLSLALMRKDAAVLRSLLAEISGAKRREPL